MKRGKIVIIILILIVAAVAIYFTFFYARKCGDMGCFNGGLVKCKRVSYMYDAEDGAWLYGIKGRWKGECKIKVTLLKIKEGDVDIAPLEGKSMNCYLPVGTLVLPQENLARCSGLLKEKMQEVIINRLHKYISDNLGQISGELNKTI